MCTPWCHLLEWSQSRLCAKYLSSAAFVLVSLALMKLHTNPHPFPQCLTGPALLCPSLCFLIWEKTAPAKVQPTMYFTLWDTVTCLPPTRASSCCLPAHSFFCIGTLLLKHHLKIGNHQFFTLLNLLIQPQCEIPVTLAASWLVIFYNFLPCLFFLKAFSGTTVLFHRVIPLCLSHGCIITSISPKTCWFPRISWQLSP